jgi:virginiamycin B lyase
MSAGVSSGVRQVALAAFFTLGVAAQVITEYPIPAGSFPHDPALDPADMVWYTAQQGNKIGRLNPADGRVTEFAVPTPNSGPHGLVSDSAGNIWFTENNAGKIGKLDPRTGQITEYPMPEAGVRDPHTPVFDQRGILWFTAQNANRIGRLDPATGEVRLFPVPAAGARPYGIKVDASGVPWFVEFGTNKLARIDPVTFTIEEFVIPQTDARPRRLAFVPGGDLYYTDPGGGRLGRFRPSTREFKLWATPSGRSAQPYGIAADAAGIVWYNEASVSRIVRFDPSAEAFSTVAIPTPGSTVRHMETDSTGRIWLAESGIDRIGKLEPAPRLSTAGVVNAAGFEGTQVAPGQIIAIFGTNLAFAAAAAASLPLPRDLGGASLTLGSLALPLFYVAPMQVNAQVPFEAPPGETTLRVRQGQEGSTVVTVAAAAPGIFVLADGRTAAAVDGVTGRPINSENPAAAGSVVTLYASGLGAVNPPVASGVASPSEPLSSTTLAVAATVAGQPATILFSGLAPGFAGLYQLNLRLPMGTAAGPASVVITVAGVPSNVAQFLIK